MKKITIISIFFLLLFLIGQFSFARVVGDDSDLLGPPKNIGLLPTSPFYFLKEWKRGIVKFFTFDPVKKAELELRYNNEKLVEAIEVAEATKDSPQREQALRRAFDNYARSHEALVQRIEKLDPKNPNVEKLKEKFAEKLILHLVLFDDLVSKGDEVLAREGNKGITMSSGEKSWRTMAPEQAQKGIENALEKLNLPEGVKELKALEVLTRIEENLPEEAKKGIETAKENIEKRLIEERKIDKIAPESVAFSPDGSLSVGNVQFRGESFREIVKELKERATRVGGPIESLNELERRIQDLTLQVDVSVKEIKPSPVRRPLVPREKTEPVKDCGPMPATPGNWVCKDGKWQLLEKEVLPELQRMPQRPVEEMPQQTTPTSPIETPSILPVFGGAAAKYTVEADDYGLYPSVITVSKGSKVQLTFKVRSQNVYYGGLEFRSSKFRTPAISPGGLYTVEFVADESFSYSSYWPASGVKKADGKIEVSQ